MIKKQELISSFEKTNYPLSSIIKNKMIQNLTCTQIMLKLADMAAMPAITKY